MADFYVTTRQRVVEKVQATISFGATDTSKSYTLSGSGLVRNIAIKVPNFTANVTLSYVITSAFGCVVKSDSNIARNSNYTNYDPFAISGDYTVTLTLSGQPTSDGDILMEIYLI